METNTLTIKRTADLINRFSKNTVVVNDRVEAKIANGQTLKFDLTGDRHQVSVGGIAVEVDFTARQSRTLIVKTNTLSKIIFCVYFLLILSTGFWYLYLKFNDHEGARPLIGVGALIIFSARYFYRNKIECILE